MSEQSDRLLWVRSNRKKMNRLTTFAFYVAVVLVAWALGLPSLFSGYAELTVFDEFAPIGILFIVAPMFFWIAIELRAASEQLVRWRMLGICYHQNMLDAEIPIDPAWLGPEK